MAQARRALAKALPSQDVIIEVLDARMPHASSNPIVTALRRHKPCIKLLSKADLADPAVTEAWVRHLESEGAAKVEAASKSLPAGRVIAITSSDDRFAKTKLRLPELCQKLVGRVSSPARPVRAMVVGIPNVGKSTIINVLLGRKVAKVGDEPAVTKRLQQVTLQNGFLLTDNPGLLWPKITDDRVGFKLAFGGAISEAALDYEAVARFGAGLLLERYPDLVVARYKLKAPPTSGHELLAEIGRRRGCLRSGNVIDMHKAADVLIHDFRGGVIGRVSLEKPADLTLESVDPSEDEGSIPSDEAALEPEPEAGSEG